MPKSFANDPRRREQVASPEFTRLLLFAFGIAMLLGVVSGVVWIGWNLLRVRLG